jgi:hypothetical protein
MGDRRHRLEVDHHATGIGERLDEDGLCALADGGGHGRRVGGVDERGAPAKAPERVAQLGERAAVELAGRDDVIARIEQRVEGEHLGGVTGGRRDGGTAALERRDPLLQGGDRGVRDPRVDVAERLEVEERRRVVGVVEDVRGRLVDGHVPRARDRIRMRPRVDRPGREAVRLVGREGRLGWVRRVVEVVGHRSADPRRLERIRVLTPLQASSPLSRPYSIFMQ